jgi:hypothetical protein
MIAETSKKEEDSVRDKATQGTNYHTSTHPTDDSSHTMGDNGVGFGETAASAATVQENVAELQFGAEFDDIQILSNAQVAVILQVSAASAVNRDEDLNEVYRKTQKYVNRFNSMTNSEKVHQELVDELDNLQEYVLSSCLRLPPWDTVPSIHLTLSSCSSLYFFSILVPFRPFVRKPRMATSWNSTALKSRH